MPTRRMFLQDEGIIDDGGQGGGFGDSSLFAGFDDGGGMGEMEDPGPTPGFRLPDDLGEPVAGSRESAREFGSGRGTASVPVPGEQQFQIPQGVTASPTGNASFTPSAPLAPAPVSAQPGNPMSVGATAPSTPFAAAAPAASAAASGPRRVSPLISSALFPETRGGQVLGAAGGLMGGGLGVPGGSQRGGTPNPTEQMLALLRALSQGA